MRIYTNWHKRTFMYYHDLPEKYQKLANDDFYYLNDDEKFDHWIVYKNWLYHISDFMAFGYAGDAYRSPTSSHWNGYIGDSFFSGILLHICEDDSEYYQIATYIS